MPELTHLADLRRVLTEARTIAVLGASPRAERPGHYVPAYLLRQGYRILPVNPAHVGKELFDQPVRATLAELDEPVDLVDVFRRPAALPGHLDDLLAMTPRPGTVWLQLGIRHDGFAADLVAAGIDVVQSRCTLADHRAWSIPPVRR